MPRFFTLFLLMIIAGCGGGAQTDSGQPPLNVVIIVSDALRADCLGAYGRERASTPFLDALAAEGAVFERAMSNSSYTLESVSSLLQSRLPSSSGSAGWYTATPSEELPQLGGLFKAAGYRTGFFTSTYVLLMHPQFRRGWTLAEEIGWEGRDQAWAAPHTSPAVTERALEFVADDPQSPFLLYLHYLDPHAPYEPSEETRALFPEFDIEAPLGLYFDVRPHVAELTAAGFGPGDPRFEDFQARYEAEIADVDRAVEDLFEGLDKIGALDNTLVIFTSDHGEEFLDHGFVDHAWTVYEESLHVPLIVWRPGMIEPERYVERVSLLDLTPTAMRLAGLNTTGNGFEGTPLFEREEDSWVFTAPEGPWFAELLVQHRHIVRAVIEDDWKYIAGQRWLSIPERSAVAEQELELATRVHQGDWEFIDPWGKPAFEALFDLSEDPGETDNRIDAGEGVTKEAAERLEQFRGTLAGYEEYCKGFARLSLQERSKNVEVTEDMKRRMGALGYAN